MKPNQTKGGNPVHQTVAEKIQFESAGQSIEIEFTDQQLSPHAGTATFWSFVHESGWREVVARKRKRVRLYIYACTFVLRFFCKSNGA